jgi:hypothetical protein
VGPLLVGRVVKVEIHMEHGSILKIVVLFLKNANHILSLLAITTPQANTNPVAKSKQPQNVKQNAK